MWLGRDRNCYRSKCNCQQLGVHASIITRCVQFHRMHTYIHILLSLDYASLFSFLISAGYIPCLFSFALVLVLVLALNLTRVACLRVSSTEKWEASLWHTGFVTPSCSWRYSGIVVKYTRARSYYANEIAICYPENKNRGQWETRTE